MSFIYKYSQLTQEIPYQQAKEIIDQFHSTKLGQLKLFTSELMFLSKFSSPNDLVLYIGSANGFHLLYLVPMFPELKFELWDASKFTKELYDLPNVKIFNRLFKDSDTKRYENKNNILLISDIRNTKVKKGRLEELVAIDMNLQKHWSQIIKPKRAFLKFRLSYQYDESKFTKYFTGTIYLQAYMPLSGESRLCTDNYIEMKEYNDKEYDEKLSYFNFFIRNNKDLNTQWKDSLSKYKFKNTWDNNLMMYTINFYFNQKNIKHTNDEVAEKFDHIWNFFYKQYGKKYKCLKIQ